VLEYLEGSTRVSKLSTEHGVIPAATWIGLFHRIYDSRASTDLPAWLRPYDATYYQSWADRTRDFASQLGVSLPWLPELCERIPETFAPLAADRVVIHGEFYPHNVLARDRVIYPVDWETAALGAGEIDLAALTEGWPDDISTHCERAYATARWPDGAPESFALSLMLARLYLVLRWLGDRLEWSAAESSAPRWARLRQLNESLGSVTARSARCSP
jgi:aminoglycoside phosphotransferase (APT) family kinase protein